MVILGVENEALLLIVVLVLKLVGFEGITPDEVALLNTFETDEPESITFTPLKEAVYPAITALVKSSVADAEVNPSPELREPVAEV
jgi:hypothetical protein